MITPLNQNKKTYITPDAEEPDLSNGPFLSFTGTNGSIAYIQMTNDCAIWIKQVSADEKNISTANFDPGCSKRIIDYLVQRLKETEK